METILSLLAIGVVYSVVFVIKSIFSKNPGVEAKPMMSEVFPEIKDYEQVFAQEDITPQRKERPVDKARGDFEKKPLEEVVTTVDKKREHKRFSISGKSEARRAFIYSEILNRKY